MKNIFLFLSILFFACNSNEKTQQHFEPTPIPQPIIIIPPSVQQTPVEPIIIIPQKDEPKVVTKNKPIHKKPIHKRKSTHKKVTKK